VADLSQVPSSELHAELGRREKEAAAESFAKINAEYGPCPECGEAIRSASSKIGREHRQAKPEWRGFYGEPPPEGTEMIGADYDLAFSCENGHTWSKAETVFYDKPIPMFG
jgi:hypothetical protein